MTYILEQNKMAFDAAFVQFTGSARPVEPLSLGYHHPDQEILNNTETFRTIDQEGRQFDMILEYSDHATELSNFMQASVKQGDVLTDSMYRILGVEMKALSQTTTTPYDALPALESLDGNMSRRELTIAMENMVTDAIKGIWEKLRDAFLSIHKKIKDWYLKAWDGSVRLQKQAEALKARAEQLNTPPKEPSFEMGGVKLLNIAGKVPAPSELIQALGSIETVSNTILTKTAENYNKLFDRWKPVLDSLIEQAKKMKGSDSAPDDQGKPKVGMGDAFGGIDTVQATTGASITNGAGGQFTSNGEVNKFVQELNADWSESMKNIGIDQVIQDARWDKEGVEVKRSKFELPGGFMIVATNPVDQQGKGLTVADYSSLKTAYTFAIASVVNPPKEVDDNGSFKTLNSTEITNICDNVINQCKVFLNYKLLYQQRDRSTENLVKQMEQHVSSTGNLVGTGSTHVKNTIQTTMALIKKLNGGEAAWCKYTMQVLNKSINYCKGSLSQY